MGAVIYMPLFHIGIKLDYGWNAAYYLITLLTVKLFWIASLICFYLALGFSGINLKWRTWLVFALGIASLHFTWSSTFNNHSLVASQLIIGFYFFLRARSSGFFKSGLFISGFFLSLAGTADIPSGAFYLGFLCLVLINRELREHSLYYLLPLFFTIFPLMLTYYYISGSFIPIQLDSSFFKYSGSWWNRSNELAGFTINKGAFLINYTFNSLLGTKGFLIYNPLLFIALFYMINEIKNKRAFRQEAIVIGIISLIIIFYYLVFTNNYGGHSYSFRWFVPMLPLLFFFGYPFFEKVSIKRKQIFMTLYYLSVIIACIGLINPWSNTSYSKSPLIANIKQLIFYHMN
jgi:hypothetical protein